MRHCLLILLAVLTAGLMAEESAPRPLDPANPADAVQIINILTEKIALPRDQAVALTRAIETLAKLAQSQTVPLPVLPASTDSPKGTP